MKESEKEALLYLN